MKQIYVVILVAIVMIAIAAYFWRPRRKETWFSRDIIYGKANSKLWNKYLEKNAAGVVKLDEEIKQMYKYPGTGSYTGMRCRAPGNIRCTTYNNFT